MNPDYKLRKDGKVDGRSLRSDYSRRPNKLKRYLPSPYIPLTRGKVSIVSPEDHASLAKVNWHLSGPAEAGYAAREENKRCIKMHRVIVDCPDGYVVDHINGNTLDNRRENLRICKAKDNSRNARAGKNSSSGIRGVSWNRQHHKWRTRIIVDGECHELGMFSDSKRAALVYNIAARHYYNNFVRAQ